MKFIVCEDRLLRSYAQKDFNTINESLHYMYRKWSLGARWSVMTFDTQWVSINALGTIFIWSGLLEENNGEPTSKGKWTHIGHIDKRLTF